MNNEWELWADWWVQVGHEWAQPAGERGRVHVLCELPSPRREGGSVEGGEPETQARHPSEENLHSDDVFRQAVDGKLGMYHLHLLLTSLPAPCTPAKTQLHLHLFYIADAVVQSDTEVR